jgi:regulator of protease activity HflC (stomatin/prohibitin superfamily)
MALWIAAGLAVIGLGYLTTVRTPFGHRAVIWSFGGVSYEERQPGLSLVFPFVQNAYMVDVRNQRYATVFQEGEDAGKANGYIQTSDLQEVTLRVGVVWRPVPTEAAYWYDEVGSENAPSIMESIIRDALKQQSGLREVESFAQELGPLGAEMAEQIVTEVAQYHMEVTSVQIEDAVFDGDFIQSVKEKVIADQEVEEQRKLIEARRAEKEQITLQAEAERARAAALGLSPQEYLEWLWLTRWDGQLPQTLLSDAAEIILNGAP